MSEQFSLFNLPPPIRMGATFDESKTYRYTLVRSWGEGKKKVVFVMLNPSTANALEDDPTVRRCIGFAKSWGYDELEIVNLFAFRSTKPEGLKKIDDPIGEQNNETIVRICKSAGLIGTRDHG